MRRTSARLSLAAAGLAVVGLVGSASAAVGPTVLSVDDMAGDARTAQAGDDITNLTVTTTGTTTTKKVGRKSVKTYTPKALVVTVKLAGAPDAVPFAQVEVKAVTSACGNLRLYYDPQHLGDGNSIQCGAPGLTGTPSTFDGTAPTVTGSTISWVVTLPVEMKPGTTVTSFDAFTYLGDPLTGAGTANVGPSAYTDDVTSDAVYKL